MPTAYPMVQDLDSTDCYVPMPWGTRFPHDSRTYPMPEGHCMFSDPYGYGGVPVRNGVPYIPPADLPRVREIIVRGMREYWRIAKYPHAWRDLYPEKSDAQALARSLAHFMSDRRMRFPVAP